MSKSYMKLYKKIESNLTDKTFLSRIELTKKAIMEILSENHWKQHAVFLEEQDVDCGMILHYASGTLKKMSPEPKEGWLAYIYKKTLSKLFPEVYGIEEESEPIRKARLFLLELMRTVFQYQENKYGFSRIQNMEQLDESQVRTSSIRDEYNKFCKFWNENYILEFMRIGREITPYNTLGHICGVHFTALHVAKQLATVGVPVDLALVSGAAAGHDLGKYGCNGEEAKRIPYLHYYYTDQILRCNDMPMIAHIASNHSTWDLELENLSVESLILIYADFRVKSSRNQQGVETVNFYSLKEAFNVILGKLDNVDEAKTLRYKKVYAKLKDFEEYMVRQGVSAELNKGWTRPEKRKDIALLDAEEVVDGFKYLAIDHNIRVMNKFSNQAAFGNLIEAARSEKFWKNLRAYMNVLDEYSTYMTQEQKKMTLYFLYDILSNKEGDIRRQAATLMGKIIVNYDEEYRKELPQGVTKEMADYTSLGLWEFYLGKIIFPDHKVTEQHRSWIGYTLKIVLISALEHMMPEEQKKYLTIYLDFFSKKNMDSFAMFALLDSMLHIPLELCTREEFRQLLEFTEVAMQDDSESVQVAALRFIEYVLEQNQETWIREHVASIVRQVAKIEAEIGADYLYRKIKIQLGEESGASEISQELWNAGKQGISDIFLENLKVDTPWVIKAVNIEYLLETVKAGKITEILHVATHFSNLLKVSERITLRHAAGRGLLEVVKQLPLDQRNELVIELTRGLEIGEYEYTKYIPEYLGALALYLHPNELDELLNEFHKLLENTNEKVVSVTLDTVGVVLKKLPEYPNRFAQSEEEYQHKENQLLGMLMRGLANYNEAISQETLRIIGQHIFGSDVLSLQRKQSIFCKISKKMLTLIMDQKEHLLTFFTNAAACNHIYRFLSEHMIEQGKLEFAKSEKIAFFPGTFDPFSLGHKGIVTSIRDLGFEVYLALDEFSWSKKTQPRMLRRKIITMSIADEANVYLFPDDEPVNIANPKDLKKLREMFAGKELYLVVGSDVVINASSYKTEPVEHSIHSLNHIVFRRESAVEGLEKKEDLSELYKDISGKVVQLTLPVHLEDISSTRIRENIDDNRDISNLIDPIAQNYIYENSLYLREPQYKHIMQTKRIYSGALQRWNPAMLAELESITTGRKKELLTIQNVLEEKSSMISAIRDGSEEKKLAGLAAVKEISISNLYEEFQNAEMAAYLRSKATGKILLIEGIYYDKNSDIVDLVQRILTETLAQALEKDFSYAVYHPKAEWKVDQEIIKTLERQGFCEIYMDGIATGIFEVDMHKPMAVIQNMETVLKAPFDKNKKVLEAIQHAHVELQLALTKLYPGNLVLSIHSGIMHHKIIEMVTRDNGVPSEPTKVRNLGPYMCVPFGKILRRTAVPNTVTKTIHTEKQFEPDLKGFSIKEYPNYSPIENQVKTIKSFNRPVILVDDLLHKGYRMKKLDPILRDNHVEVKKLVVGLLSGNGKDLMTIQGRKVDSAYFIPNLRSWFVESSLYPFIGGDGIRRDDFNSSGLQTSINMILPYVSPNFLTDAPKKAIYDFSMVCLNNAYRIFLALEEEYQKEFQRKLTLERISDAVVSPRVSDQGSDMKYDMNLAPSRYLMNGIERLIRLENIIT